MAQKFIVSEGKKCLLVITHKSDMESFSATGVDGKKETICDRVVIIVYTDVTCLCDY